MKRLVGINKKLLPFGVRKLIRHNALTLKRKELHLSNRAFAEKHPGYPFKEGHAYNELKIIESFIRKYNIYQ